MSEETEQYHIKSGFDNFNLIVDLLFIPLAGTVSAIIIFSPLADIWFSNFIKSKCSRNMFKIILLFLTLYLIDRIASAYRTRMIHEISTQHPSQPITAVLEES